MRRVVLGCLLLASATVCNCAEKQSLEQFLEAVVASLGYRHDEHNKDIPAEHLVMVPRELIGHRRDMRLNAIPDHERLAQVRVMFARDQRAVADAYLATRPPIGAAARRAVDGYRAAKAREVELYERLLAEKRYEPTAAEKKQDAEGQAEAQRHLETIGRMVDK